MSSRIYKYPLGWKDEQCIHIPRVSRARYFALQSGTPTLWVEVDTEETSIPITFYIVGTGQDIPDNAVTYHGTVQDSVGFVWHLYSNGRYL